MAIDFTLTPEQWALLAREWGMGTRTLVGAGR